MDLTPVCRCIKKLESKSVTLSEAFIPLQFNAGDALYDWSQEVVVLGDSLIFWYVKRWHDMIVKQLERINLFIFNEFGMKCDFVRSFSGRGRNRNILNYRLFMRGLHFIF